MNIITKYECGCCKTQYTDRDAALKCELNHKSPMNVTGVRYVSISSDATGYPMNVQILMSDGKSVLYKRQREV